MRVFWVLVVAPLAVAGYLAVRVSGETEALRRHELQGLLDGRLADVRARTGQAFAAIERDLDARLVEAPGVEAPRIATAVATRERAPRADAREHEAARSHLDPTTSTSTSTRATASNRTRAGSANTGGNTSSAEDTRAVRGGVADELRAYERTIPLARQLFRLDPNGRLVFPARSDDASRAELEFLERTASIWNGTAILESTRTPAKGEPRTTRHTAAGIGDSLVDLAVRQPSGWTAWYWAEGLHLLYWRRAADGGVIGVEVERVGVLARIVGALPTAALEDGRMELADSRGQTVHQWGPMLPAEGAPIGAADASLALAPPLDSWQLRYYISADQRGALAGGLDPGWLLGLAAFGLALIALAIVVYREITRRLREAAARVDFVTRVSHELRTPLTNIRMYAELLEDGATEPDDERRARVIVAETQRLGRLIDNVLAYARDQRGTLAARADEVDVDAVVREAVASFEPALAARSIQVDLALAAATHRARAAADAVDQIVVNLLSNVEKYAAAGGEVRVATRVTGDRVIVRVADRGPGVPARERDAIFEPFHRTSDSLTGVTGTGIGLAISRELARSSGGELALVDAAASGGACFELSLPAIARRGGEP